MRNTVLKKLSDKSIWQEVFDNYAEKSYHQTSKMKFYKDFLTQNLHLQIVTEILELRYNFRHPKLVQIKKNNSGKLKTVFLMDYQDDFLCKVINKIICFHFAHLISPLCFSFQSGKSAKHAFYSVLRNFDFGKDSCLKTDIKNFFNSISIHDFIEKIPPEMKMDKPLMYCLKNIYENNTAIDKFGKEIKAKKGLMAGTPLAPFLSNIYLRNLDDYFQNQEINYARYSDDIIILDSYQNLQNHQVFLNNYLNSINLQVNPLKTKIYSTGNKWTFLGFSYLDGKIDISEANLLKFKKKIRRMARKYNRWKQKKQVNDGLVLTKFVNNINRKLYGIESEKNELCWAKWYFPVINQIDGLSILDKFLQDKLRFAVCGKYSKQNYKQVPYKKLKEFNYIPLKTAYFKFKKGEFTFEKDAKQINE